MRTIRIMIAVQALVLLPMAVHGVQRRVPADSYLRKPVSSVNELAATINKDPVVRQRFAKHFRVLPGMLTQYIQDNVVITKVSANTPRKVYIVTRSGQMIAQRKVLKSGTPIFAMRDTGEPLLVLECGNPVLKKLPQREKVKAASPQTYQLVRANEMPLPPALAAPPAVVPPIPVTLIAPIPPVTPPVTSVPVVVAGGGKASLLPLLGGLFIGHNGGHKTPPPPPPIPEPGGVATVLASGLLPAAGYGVMRLRAYRRREESN